MNIGHQIEQIRQKRGLSIIDVCNICDISEGEYQRLITNKLQPTVYQLCMFIAETRHPLDLESLSANCH